MKKNNYSGFTLIELVVVIVILATLAVVAFPRFFSYQRDAHLARADAAFSSFESAVQMYHSKWLAEGEPSGVVDYATGDIFPSTTGYPLTLRTDNAPDHLEGDDCIDLWRSLLNTDLTVDRHTSDVYGSESDIVAWFTGDKQCYYYYTSGFDEKERLPVLHYSPITGQFTQDSNVPSS